MVSFCGVLLWGAYVCSLFYAGYFDPILILCNAMFIGVLAYLINAINLGILAVNIWGFIWWFGLLEYVRIGYVRLPMKKRDW